MTHWMFARSQGEGKVPKSSLEDTARGGRGSESFTEAEVHNVIYSCRR